MPLKLSWSVLLLLAVTAACGGGGTGKTSGGERENASPPAAAPAPAAAAGKPLVIFLGDSLTAGLGLAEEQAYPALLERRLAGEGRPVRVINAGVSGDTTAGGLARLDWLLDQKPDLMVVGLGANDGLRGLPLTETEKNLREIVRRCRAAGARVLLLGMKIPPNYGPDYAGGFAALYPRIARDLHVPLVPFLLQGVGGVAELNQADGIHPTAEGQEKVADTVLPYLTTALGAP
jgi:acyl-CoA thioesterase I